MSRNITVADLCALTGYSRDQLRGLLNELPMYARRKSEERVAHIYSSRDVLVIVVCCRLESVYGLKRSTVSSLARRLATVLAVPRPVARGARLVLTLQPPSVSYVEHIDDLPDGLVMALEPVFSTIDNYLLPFMSRALVAQGELAAAPGSIQPITKPAARRESLAGPGLTRPRSS